MKKEFNKKGWLKVMAILLAFMVFPIAVEGKESETSDEDKTLSPYFHVEGEDPETDRFPLKNTDVAVNISGVVANVTIVQTYINEGKNPINASYIFPASVKAAVHGMKMKIGNKTITAVIKEKKEAKDIFDEAKKKGKSASLLEQKRPNVFSMDVANVMPGDKVNIELKYSELIVSAEGTYQFVFPTVVGPRYSSKKNKDTSDDSVTGTYLVKDKDLTGKYDIRVNLAAGLPISSLNCSSHDIKKDYKSPQKAAITLANPNDYAGNRDFILDYVLTGTEIECGIMLNKGVVNSNGESEDFFMLMVQPPERPIEEEILPREYVFVIDVSGSMYGYPLKTSKTLMKNLLSSLGKNDLFNLIIFSDDSFRMSKESVSATRSNIDAAIKLINKEKGGGGTEMAKAMKLAVETPVTDSHDRSIVMITDGYVDEEVEIFDIIDDNIENMSFFSFGIGKAVNRYLVEGIARAGQGESFVVTKAAQASDTARQFCDYVRFPVLSDIEVTFDGFSVMEVEPVKIPTLFAWKPIVLLGKWNGEANGIIRITGKTGNKPYEKKISISEITEMESDPAISYLWAKSKVDRLMCYGLYQSGAAGKVPDAIKEEVTLIGLKYSMITQYTSFVAVMDEVRNDTGEAVDVEQALPLPEGVSKAAIGNITYNVAGGSTLRNGWRYIYIPVGVLLIACLMMYCGKKWFLK